MKDYLPPTFRRGSRSKEKKEEINLWLKLWQKTRKFFIWGIILGGIYWFYNPHGIFVLGDPLSVYRYRTVLSDLKREMPDEYALVRNHIHQISINYMMFGGRAGSAHNLPSGNKVNLLENTFVQGPGYAHSVLVHEACHGLQFEKNLPFSPFCEYQSREHACNEWGIKVLKRFNGKPEMIAYYEKTARGDTVYGNSCERNGYFVKMPEL